MSEKFPDRPFEGGSNMDRSPHFDPLVRGVLRRLTDNYFSPEKRASFYKNTDTGQQVDDACWVLAGNPETYNQSINLRALYIIRQLDVATRTTSSSESWSYSIILDDFWNGVDKAMSAYLHKHADRMHYDSEVHQSIIEGHHNSVIFSEQNIAEMNDRLICRKTYRNVDSNIPHTIVYEVLPADTY